MSRLYTIKHGKGYIRTGSSYRSNLDIVNKETLVHVGQRLGVEGVAKYLSKEKMTDAISGFVLSHPEECLKLLSVKELLLLKDFVEEGADASVVRPNRKYYDTLRELLFVSTYHDKKKRSLYFLLPDELRELFAPLLDKLIKEAKKRDKADRDVDDGFVEEIIGMGHRHYDSLGEFLSHLNDHDSFDSVLAIQDFWNNANVVKSENAIVTLYATVVYVIRLTGKIIYRSTEPIEVLIDTYNLNTIFIPDLPSSCLSKFSTETEVMNYAFGVLTIEGNDKDNTPFVVSLI